LKYLLSIIFDLIIYVHLASTIVTKYWLQKRFLSAESRQSKQKQVNPNLLKGTSSEDRRF